MFAREGWAPAALVTAAALVVVYWLGPLWSVPVWLLLLGVVAVFAESKRAVPAVPLAVVSPVDAMVTAVGPEHDPWLERDALAIRLRVRFPGITSLRSPTEAKVMDFYANFGSPGGAPSGSPTLYAQWLQTDEADDVTVCVSTLRHSRFKAGTAPGERVGQGARSGFVYFASEVTVYVPSDAHPRVGPGDAVFSGSSIVAVLVHSSSE